jgi:hypothetical protein
MTLTVPWIPEPTGRASRIAAQPAWQDGRVAAEPSHAEPALAALASLRLRPGIGPLVQRGLILLRALQQLLQSRLTRSDHEHLDDARPELLAFTGYPREIWRQIWSNNPVRHEAPCDRAEMEGLRLRVVAAA